MTRSKLRKIRRLELKRNRALALGAGILLSGMGVAQAQNPGNPDASGADVENEGLEQVIVTALKSQAMNLQDVPLSMQAIGTERLEELGVNGFDDYVKFLPSVSFQQAGPGFARVFMRGAAAGDNGNHSGPQPGVGQYLDEQPITTIQGALDIHMYDIARVESLAGPQGTLYGASSQSGTIRIITNKPDASGFDAGYSLQGNTVADGDAGYLAEGFVNVPLSDNMAIRLVGWVRHDGGYIDNLPATRTFPGSGITIESLAEENYNEADTYGARAALKIDLNDNWTITPTIMAQKQEGNGIYAGQSDIGDRAVTHWHPEGSDDQWMQAALTVEGRMSNFDVTFASSYLKRDVEVQSDYSDYSFFYDTLTGGSFSEYFTDNNGDLVNPSQYINGTDGYTKASHELRFSTDPEKKLRFVGGLFYQRQTHDIQQEYRIDNLNDDSDVTGWDDVFWLTKQWRVDRDMAVFGEVTYDFTDRFSVTGGLRQFRYENSLEGFYGFGATNPFESNTGENSCVDTGQVFETAPCTNLDTTVKDNGNTYRINASFHVTEDAMLYATVSEGFRPGGVNRRGSFPPYDPDFLTNYEVGWKTSWMGNRVRFNGAIFRGQWDDFQFSYLGENGLTNITNAGSATLQGIEVDVQWAATDNFTLYGGLALQDAELGEDFCKLLDPLTGLPYNAADCTDIDPAAFAPEGSRLPTTPRFKFNLTGRNEFQLGAFDAHFQASFVHNDSSLSALLPLEAEILGEQDSYSLIDLSFGIAKEKWSAELFIDNALDESASLYRYAECDASICGGITYGAQLRPRTIGLKFSQKF